MDSRKLEEMVKDIYGSHINIINDAHENDYTTMLQLDDGSGEREHYDEDIDYDVGGWWIKSTDVEIEYDLKHKKELSREDVLKHIKYGCELSDIRYEKHMEDKELIIEGVKLNPDILSNLPDKYKNDPEVVITALKEDSHAIFKVGDSMRLKLGNLDHDYRILVLNDIINITKENQYLEEKITPSVNLKSLADLREEQGLTRKNKI